MSDETPLQELNEQLKDAHVDAAVTIEHNFTPDDTLTVVVDPVKESESVDFKVKF